MAEIEVVVRDVRQRWLLQGLRVSSVRPEDLVTLSRLGSDGIPEEYQAFLRIAGLPDDEDAAGFRFWRPTEVRATDEVLHAAGYTSHASEQSVIIADYLQESWWYCLWLSGPFAGRVSLVLGQADGRDPQPPLGSFAEFLLAYLGDDARLYPPASSPEEGT